MMSFFKEFLGSIRKPKKKHNVIKICPNCKKNTIYRANAGNWAQTEYYKCQNCEYEGAFYLEVDLDETGENFMDLEKLSRMYPEAQDKETTLDKSSSNLKNILESPDSKNEVNKEKEKNNKKDEKIS
jgi:predicted RNA-binding Zn-ribbon protein involved in translation (DUF1610 family)